MKRRPITVMTAIVVAAAVVSALQPTPARANGIIGGTASYRLTTAQDIPVPDANATAPQVIAEVVPPGTVVPPSLSDGTPGSPLTILSSSSGFDQNQLIVALKDGTNTSGQTQQLFGLSFFGNGFSQHGQLDFSLNLGNSVSTPPQLQSLTPGVSIVALQTSSPNTTTSTTTTTVASPDPTVVQNTVPEPISVVLWSTAAGLGLLRARSVRRRMAA